MSLQFLGSRLQTADFVVKILPQAGLRLAIIATDENKMIYETPVLVFRFAANVPE